MVLLYIIETILFLVFLTNIVYLLFFSIASHCKVQQKQCKSQDFKRIAILIPAYKEDTVILECVHSCLEQDYPSDKYDIIVISDQMSEETNQKVKNLGIKLISVYFENSTKAKALNYAMSQLDDCYDMALILDADNTIKSDFLSRVNDAFFDDVKIVQAHRCAKNLNTNLALLDAVSEEINNSIFRLGHVNVGLSAALIGSGMCFDYQLFKQTMLSINAVGGFDRALELTLLKDGIKIYYLPDADVLDEKVQHHKDFSRQRRRWLSAQLHYFCENIKEIPTAVRDRKYDFCDKMFQQMSIPRVMLLGFCGIIALVMSFINFALAIKWWILLIMIVIALMLAIPKYLFKKELLIAIVQLPYFFILMTLNIFKLKGANKKFIHTSHGVKQ